jgi:hypothetical protein
MQFPLVSCYSLYLRVEYSPHPLPQTSSTYAILLTREKTIHTSERIGKIIGSNISVFTMFLEHENIKYSEQNGGTISPNLI